MMGWAGRKLTDRTRKGESEGECLDNGTCPGEPASLCRESVELEKAVDAQGLEEAGGDLKAF